MSKHLHSSTLSGSPSRASQGPSPLATSASTETGDRVALPFRLASVIDRLRVLGDEQPAPHVGDTQTGRRTEVGDDLRRRRRRDQARELVERARALSPGDAELLKAVFERGMTVASIADGMGVAPPRLRRRVRSLVRRVTAPRFVYVSNQLHRWTSTRRRVAEVCFLRGRSMRQACEELGLTLHVVRAHHAAIRSEHEAVAALLRQVSGRRAG